MSELRQTNEIIKVQTAKKLIGLTDKLRHAPKERYAQIHSRGETLNGKKLLPSLVGVFIQDYSAGRGESNTIVNFNLKPEEVQFLLTRVTAGFLDFDWSAQKIYGTPDTSGMCPSENFHVCRHQVDGQGRPLNSPWQITISNGKGIKIANQNGGFYMKFCSLS